jgi:hypothetical protein
LLFVLLLLFFMALRNAQQRATTRNNAQPQTQTQHPCGVLLPHPLPAATPGFTATASSSSTSSSASAPNKGQKRTCAKRVSCASLSDDDDFQ